MALRKDLRILVVDDMSVSRQILVQTLERFGIRHLRTAASGEAALEALRGWTADLVISDLSMPGMDGAALLETLRGRHGTRAIRFVLTSGHDSSPRFDQARKLGLDALLVKPFRTERLLECIEDIAGRI